MRFCPQVCRMPMPPIPAPRCFGSFASFARVTRLCGLGVHKVVSGFSYQDRYILKGRRTKQMSGQLRDKVAIVTGSGHGIGRSLVLAMAKEGAKIVTNDIKSERAEKVAKEIFEMGGTAIPFTCDIA